ncbi:hypothetical protein [Sinosporangium siamense]
MEPPEDGNFSSPSFDEIVAAGENDDLKAIRQIDHRVWWNAGMIGSWRAESERISERLCQDGEAKRTSGDHEAEGER